MRWPLTTWLFVPLLLGGFAAAQVWLSHVRYELSQQTQRLNAEKQALALEVSKLNLEVASLTRPERLREIAQRRLHMAPPRPLQVVHP